MFEKEIGGYAFNITKRYTSERVRLSTLLADTELPEDFRKFAEAEVEEAIDLEGLGVTRTGKFDFSGSEIQALFKEVRHVLKNSYEFSREDFLELADKASKFIFNYVIRPKWTLEKFLFKGSQQTARPSVEKASRFLNCYIYYPKGIVEYLDFHEKNDLDVESWRKLHAKIDEHLLSTLPAKLSSLTLPLFDLFEFASGVDRVPAEAMVLFFRDKSAADIVDRIEFAKEVKNIRSVDVMTLAMILEASATDVSQNVAVLPKSDEPAKEFRTFERQRASHPIHPAEPPRREPANPAMSEMPGELPSQDEPERFRAEPPLPRLQSDQPPAPHKGASTTSVRNFMSAKLEDKIVRKIFKGSRSGYQVAMHRIDESADWQTASRIVEGIFIDNDVDPFSKYAVAFTDAVSAKFKSGQIPQRRS